jgi:xylitol oxidase
MTSIQQNWAGSFTFTATEVHTPESLDELRRIVASTPKIHAIGSRHSFNGLADGAVLISLERMPKTIAIDPEARTVIINPGMNYSELAVELHAAGWALHNMASLPHITVGGAVATATHGSGDRNGNLSTAVAAMELVTADGELVRVKRGDPDFNGMVAHIGALGVVASLTLDIQPTYLVRQEVFEHLSWDTLYASFDDIMGSADSVSIFTDWGDTAGQLLCKSLVDPEQPWEGRAAHFGATAATRPLHPVSTLPADPCTEQLGMPGAWHERVPHFRIDAVPSVGHELQTEYMVAREHAVPAIKAMRSMAAEIQPVLLISEIRTAAADDLWLSTAYGTDTVCLHSTWHFEPERVWALLPSLEATLAPFAPRPHWSKLFAATADELEPRYPKLGDFRALAGRLDPNGKFRNAFLDRHVFGEA